LGILLAKEWTRPVHFKGGDVMFPKKKDSPFVFIKKGDKPISKMSRERYDAAVASASKYLLKK